MTKFAALALLASVLAAPAFAAPLAPVVETKKESTVTTTTPVADAKLLDHKDAKIADGKVLDAKGVKIAETKAPVSIAPAKVETKTEVKTETTKEAK